MAGDLGQKAEQPSAGGAPHSYDLVRGGDLPASYAEPRREQEQGAGSSTKWRPATQEAETARQVSSVMGSGYSARVYMVETPGMEMSLICPIRSNKHHS